MSNLKCVIFDLDGTLIDSAPLICDILNSMRKDRLMTSLPLTEYRKWISLGAIDLIRNTFHEDLAESTKLLTCFRRAYRTKVTTSDLLYSGVEYAIKKLQSNGIKLAICSNKPELLCKKTLFETGLLNCFEIIIGGDSIAKPKPNPEPLKHILDVLQVPADLSIFVGDSTTDQKTSIAAGIPFIFFSNGYDDGVDKLKALHVIPDFFTLVDILNNF